MKKKIAKESLLIEFYDKLYYFFRQGEILWINPKKMWITEIQMAVTILKVYIASKK